MIKLCGNTALLSAAVFVFFAASAGEGTIATDFFGSGLDSFFHGAHHDFFKARICRCFHSSHLTGRVTSVRLHSALAAKCFIQGLKLRFVRLCLHDNTKTFELFQNRFKGYLYTLAAEKENLIYFLFRLFRKLKPVC